MHHTPFSETGPHWGSLRWSPHPLDCWVWGHPFPGFPYPFPSTSSASRSWRLGSYRPLREKFLATPIMAAAALRCNNMLIAIDGLVQTTMYCNVSMSLAPLLPCRLIFLSSESRCIRLTTISRLTINIHLTMTQNQTSKTGGGGRLLLLHVHSSNKCVS